MELNKNINKRGKVEELDKLVVFFASFAGCLSALSAVSAVKPLEQRNKQISISYLRSECGRNFIFLMCKLRTFERR